MEPVHLIFFEEARCETEEFQDFRSKGRRTVQPLQRGNGFFVKNASLEIPSGQSVCLFALGSILPPLMAASVPTDPENNILSITQDFQCPDPLAKVIFRVEESP